MAKEHFYTEAIWSETTSNKNYPPLSKDIEVDVAIVGAGITGMSTAALLSKAGKKVAVLEALEVGKGTTGSSTGNLYAPIDERLHSISSKHNDATMKIVVSSRMAAIDMIEDWINLHNIDCEFHRVPWYLFTTPDTSSEDSQVTKEFDAAKKTDLTATYTPPKDFPYKTSAFTGIANQAQYNPLKYLQGLANALAGENCQIYEHTKVTQVEDGDTCVVHTSGGKVRAKKVVMATHSPKGIYGVHTAMECFREYAMSFRLRSGMPANGIYWHVKKSQQYSIRPYHNETDSSFLLILGEPHKVGHEEHNEQNFKKIEAYARANFEIESVEHSWAAQNYKAADNLPYIGTSPLEKNIFIATGFAADGLVYGTLSGMILSDTMLGIENKWAKIYDPKRFTPLASAPKFIKENITVASSLLKDWLFYGNADELKDIKAGEGKTLKLNDEKVAAYRDENDKLHIVSAVCTHMGCVVHWNNGEKSWDCPCHGSRFSVDGEVLEGPAYEDLAKPEKGENAASI